MRRFAFQIRSLTIRSSDETKWGRVLNKSSKAIVSLKVSNVRSFEGDLPVCSSATGFVVDKELGIILTNRHVVGIGPVTGEAVFENHDVVKLLPIFRDPVHDFGFFKYDPKQVKFMTVGEIELYPQGARVGTEIRVVGNDAGEKIMVLRGTISRIDREPPYYSRGYNDYDTFYLTAASSTSAGSSGSPVINSQGKCVALNAGGNSQAATSFFLPLDRVERALNHVRKIVKGETLENLPRGTLDVTFRYRPFEDARNLGLTSTEEANIRKLFPKSIGMLAVGRVLPNGIGFKSGLKEGDLLLSLNEKCIRGYVELEHELDEAIATNSDVTLEVRRGRQAIKYTLKPQSLWESIPHEYLEYSDGIIHELSLNFALRLNVPQKSQILSSSGYSLFKLPVGSMISKMGDQSISSLNDILRVIENSPHNSTLPVRYASIYSPFRHEHQLIKVDRKWYPLVHRKRVLKANGETWMEVSETTSFPAQKKIIATSPKLNDFSPVIRKELKAYESDIPSKVLKSLVWIVFNVAIPVGTQKGEYFGCGTVVDAKRGLIVTDRNTVPTILGDARITVASVDLPAKVLFLHPIGNISILQVDPELLQKCDVKEIEFDNSTIVKRNEAFTFVGFTYQQQLKVLSSMKVSNLERVPLQSPNPVVPRMFDLIHLDVPPANDVIGGIFINNDGKVRATWSSFRIPDGQEYFYASSTDPISFALACARESLDSKKPIPVYSLGVDLKAMQFSKARSGFGLSDYWIDKFATEYFKTEIYDASEVLTVDRIYAGTNAVNKFKHGDILLAVNDKPVIGQNELDLLCFEYGRENKELPLLVLRDGKEELIHLVVTEMCSTATDEVINFAGLQIRPTPDAILGYGSSPEGITTSNRGCFIVELYPGSPAASCGVKHYAWITEVNENPVDSTKTFLNLVSSLKNGQVVRMRMDDLLSRTTKVFTLTIDLDYWKTTRLSLENGDWKTTVISNDHVEK